MERSFGEWNFMDTGKIARVDEDRKADHVVGADIYSFAERALI